MTTGIPLWNLDELAAYLNLSRVTVNRLAKQGKIPGRKVGGSWRFRPEAILAWLDETRVGTPVGTASDGFVRKTNRSDVVDTAAALDAIVKGAKGRANHA